jgi:hypothetical protein
MRKGALTKVARNRGSCGEKGHIRRSCTGEPKSSGREGEHDWLDSEEEPESESDQLDSIALEDQFHPELVEYNLYVERAKVIVARENRSLPKSNHEGDGHDFVPPRPPKVELVEAMSRSLDRADILPVSFLSSRQTYFSLLFPQ